jgi:hypothetical protein
MFATQKLLKQIHNKPRPWNEDLVALQGHLVGRQEQEQLENDIV